MATTEPPRVGTVPPDTPLPEYLWPIGTPVSLPSGEVGVVDYYEFYHRTQTTFPVKETSGYTRICSAMTASKACDWEVDVAATIQQLRAVRRRQAREQLGPPPAGPRPSSQAS